MPANRSRSGFTLVEIAGPVSVLVAIGLILYGVFRDPVDNWFRELFASKSVDSDNGSASWVRASLDEVQLTPAPLADNAAASPSRKFLLSARNLDKDENVIVGPSSVRWSFDPTAEGAGNDLGEITVSTFPATGSAEAKVRASSEDMADTVLVTRWANRPSAASRGDVVEFPEPRTDGVRPPSVVLVEEASELACSWGRPWAFVGAAAVGQQELNPCSVSVLSASHGMSFQENHLGDLWPPEKWAESGINLPVTPTAPLKLKVTVFLAVSPGSALGPTASQQVSNGVANSVVNPLDLAKSDIALAQVLYDANRVGMQLEVKYKTLEPSPDLQLVVGADPYDCIRPVKLPANPNAATFAYDSAAVSVYYVDRINFPPDPAYPRVRGIQCHYWYSGNPDTTLGKPPGNGPVVYISYTHHSPVTLAHELGHALGLNDEQGRLGPTDIMHNLLPDGDLGANARSHLRVGQVFRTNVWNDSWINTRLPKPPQRACNDRYPCPPVELDAY
jgi:hypothetical protein